MIDCARVVGRDYYYLRACALFFAFSRSFVRPADDIGLMIRSPAVHERPMRTPFPRVPARCPICTSIVIIVGSHTICKGFHRSVCRLTTTFPSIRSHTP